MIELSNAVIRPFGQGDEYSLARHANDMEIWRNVRDYFPNPYTVEKAAEWVTFASAQQPQVNFAIAVGPEVVGGIGLMLMDGNARIMAEVGYWLGRAHWGKGIATEAVRAISAFAFENFDLVRLQAFVYEWNTPSMRVLEKAGYVREAVLRKAAIKNGQIVDQHLFALLR